jgi:hypothetical protein
MIFSVKGWNSLIETCSDINKPRAIDYLIHYPFNIHLDLRKCVSNNLQLSNSLSYFSSTKDIKLDARKTPISINQSIAHQILTHQPIIKVREGSEK